VSLSIALLDASLPVDTSEGFLNRGLSSYEAVWGSFSVLASGIF